MESLGATKEVLNNTDIIRLNDDFIAQKFPGIWKIPRVLENKLKMIFLALRYLL